MPIPLRTPTREDVLPESRELFDRLIAGKMHGHQLSEMVQGAWMGALFWWPEYADIRIQESKLVLTAAERDGTFSHADREWVDMVLTPYLKTNVIMRGHLPDAVGAGVRIEAIEAVWYGRDEELTETERLLATYIRQVVDGTVERDTFDAVEQHMGTRGAAEYTIFITVLWQTMRQMQAFGQAEMTDDEVEQMIRDFKSGARQAPEDWRYRAVGPWDQPAPVAAG
jgi:hypothetical protein